MWMYEKEKPKVNLEGFGLTNRLKGMAIDWNEWSRKTTRDSLDSVAMITSKFGILEAKWKSVSR